MPSRAAATRLLAIALLLGGGCVAGSGSEDRAPGVERSALAPDFEEVVALCPETDDWGPWSQTSLSTWDADVRPIIEWIIDETGISCSTYSGHDPSIGRAADWRPRSREEGTRLANWLQDHLTGGASPLGLYYVMWQAQIGFSDEIRDVEDRGSFTANHCDHVHMSFYETVDFRPEAVEPWDDEIEPDAGPPPEDTGPPPEDTGPPPEDAEPPPEDTEPPPGDGGDAGVIPAPEDASPDPVDGSTPPPRDGGTGGAPLDGMLGGCGAAPSRGRSSATALLVALALIASSRRRQ